MEIANLDPSLSAQQVRHLLTLTTPKIIVSNKSSEHLIRNVWDDSEILILKDLSFNLRIAQFGEEEFRPIKVDIHDIPWIIFSSGTTGLPKGICHSHCKFVTLSMLQIIEELS